MTNENIGLLQQFEYFKLKRTITARDCEILCAYLKSHEEDIALDINDFGDLKQVYRRFLGIDAKAKAVQ